MADCEDLTEGTLQTLQHEWVEAWLQYLTWWWLFVVLFVVCNVCVNLLVCWRRFCATSMQLLDVSRITQINPQLSSGELCSASHMTPWTRYICIYTNLFVLIDILTQCLNSAQSDQTTSIQSVFILCTIYILYTAEIVSWYFSIPTEPQSVFLNWRLHWTVVFCVHFHLCMHMHKTCCILYLLG